MILAEIAAMPGGPEWLKPAREQAEEIVDARTRSGIPLARFTKKEEEAWGEEEDGVFIYYGFD